MESEIKELLKELFRYLEYTEESDSGKEFHPTHIVCTRVLMMDKVGECLKRLKELSND